MPHELAQIVANALRLGHITVYQLGVTEEKLDRLLDAAGPWTQESSGKVRKAGKHERMTSHKGKRKPVISAGDYDDLNTAIEMVHNEDLQISHEILEEIVGGGTGMHDDIRQELAEAEWRLASWENGDVDADYVVSVIQTVLDTYPVDDNQWSR